MNIQPEQHIKCLFKNGIVIEGIVKSWSREEAELLSLDNKNAIVILHPNDDIILIKIVLDNSEQLQSAEKPKSQLPKNELEQKFQQTVEQPSDTPNRLSTMADLKAELAGAEKDIIAKKLREHHLGSPRKTNYASPYDLGAIKGGTIFEKHNRMLRSKRNK